MITKLSTPITGKRKRETNPSTTTVQVVVGSYERVLHGFTVNNISDEAQEGDITFEDSFLFNAHASSIRCLALSPPSNSKRILATGSSDERINLYSLSTISPTTSKTVSRNKELGTLANHAATITSLVFPAHSKLLSASLDNTIAITRTRDWTLLSTLKAPIPKQVGRPSGDTSAPGEVPAGVTDIAVHPSQRLAISVGAGEKCMRLWNLLTGKKAGCLVFEKAWLEELGEGRWRGGEGRGVAWSEDGNELVIAFERGVLVFGLDCMVRGCVKLGVREKVGKVKYLPQSSGQTLAISTEDGRVLFYDTKVNVVIQKEEPTKANRTKISVPLLRILGQLHIGTTETKSRIKDFQMLPTSTTRYSFHIITASSDGMVHFWRLQADDLNHEIKPRSDEEKTNGQSIKSVGKLLGTYDTGRRLTCLEAFNMDDSTGPELSVTNGVGGKIIHEGEASDESDGSADDDNSSKENNEHEQEDEEQRKGSDSDGG